MQSDLWPRLRRQQPQRRRLWRLEPGKYLPSGSSSLPMQTSCCRLRRRQPQQQRLRRPGVPGRTYLDLRQDAARVPHPSTFGHGVPPTAAAAAFQTAASVPADSGAQSPLWTSAAGGFGLCKTMEMLAAAAPPAGGSPQHLNPEPPVGSSTSSTSVTEAGGLRAEDRPPAAPPPQDWVSPHRTETLNPKP